MNSFGWIDWGIIGVYLVGTMVAGLAMRRYVGKVEHFIVAGREMDVYLGIASLAATEFGIITAMYTAELGFKNGFAGATPGILMAVAMAVVGLTGFVINPLRNSGALTIPELLDRKFGMQVRWLSGLVIVLGGLLNMGVFLRIGGEFLMIVSADPRNGRGDGSFAAGFEGQATRVLADGPGLVRAASRYAEHRSGGHLPR
jgi:SSS family solute:Na+ symporter